MAKSLISILSQIDRLQKEAASIQNEVIGRVRKDIAKYGLTAEQLFGAPPERRGGRSGNKPAAPVKVRKAKYADGAGNSWSGMGKRPTWLREALGAGKSLEDFLVDGSGTPSPQPAPNHKRAAKAIAAPVKVASRAKKPAAAQKPVTRKPRAKRAGVEAAAA